MNTQQALKEYSSIVIARQSALKAAQCFASENQLKLSASDLFLLVERFYGFIETGNTEFKVKLDKYLSLKSDPLLEKTLTEPTPKKTK
jgi:hypothetical protein